MCGIVGLSGVADAGLVRAMNDSQRHRGPDDAGYYFDETDAVSLAMRRLSIIDIAGGHQPMSSPDGRFWIVFNGEIVNAPELRAQLEGEGCVFRSDHSDTEVLVQLYARHGERMLRHLNGMFAFVIHDRQRRRLFAARDHAGMKPFYYHFDGARFAFASELKSLTTLPWVGRRIDPQSLYHYLSLQCVPAPGTIYAGTAKLAAGHSLTLDLASLQLSVEPYWLPPGGVREAAGDASRSIGEYRALVRAELDAAVRRWMTSDVPVACSLSGGIDSATILGLMASQGATGIRTYSLGFDDSPDIDERAIAREVARRWDTDHQEIVLRSDNLLDELVAMVFSLDEPYAGGLPSWFVYKAMAGEAKVCMTGTGGDEVFGNYGKWRVYESRRATLRRAASLARNPRWLTDWTRDRRGSLYPLYFRDCDKRSGLLQPGWREGPRTTESLIGELWRQGEPATVRDGPRIVDQRIQLPDEFLHMTDRFSMAHSIEARPPFLDRRFMERMLEIPASIRVGNPQLKYLLVEAVRDLLPPAVTSAGKKGFVLPVARWLRQHLRPRVEHLLGRRFLEQQGIFDPLVHERLVRPHLDGTRDLSWQIWTLLMFQLWYEQHEARP